MRVKDPPPSKGAPPDGQAQQGDAPDEAEERVPPHAVKEAVRLQLAEARSAEAHGEASLPSPDDSSIT